MRMARIESDVKRRGGDRKATASQIARLGGAMLLPCVLSYAQSVQGSLDIRSTSYRSIEIKDVNDQVASVAPVESSNVPPWAVAVRQKAHRWKKSDKPYFKEPIPFVVPPIAGSDEPFYKHNHQPSITWLDNGDLMAIWYSTTTESGTELTVLASRLREGKNEWDPSSEFFKAANRNMHGSSVFNDGHGRIFHFNGIGREGLTRREDKGLALVCRSSADNGVSWTSPHLVSRVYGGTHQPVSGAFVTRKGVMIQICDSTRMRGSSKSAIYLSYDGGATWQNPADEELSFHFTANREQGRVIAGIHAGVVELTDGRLMAMGRGNDIDGRMPISISGDMGRTWKYKASSFPDIGGGQRIVLMRLREGPILLISFTDKRGPGDKTGMEFTDQRGNPFRGYGMFAALSYDDGETWQVRKLLTPGNGDYDGGAWTGEFTATPQSAEHAGYLAATQSPDGVIHLISSRLHYRFNLAWLKEPNYQP